MYSNETQSNKNLCKELKLEDRYRVSPKTCQENLTYTVNNAATCSKQQQVEYCRNFKDLTFDAKIDKNDEIIKLALISPCVNATEVKILNFDEKSTNLTELENILGKIRKIEKCLTISNSSAIKNLDMFKVLTEIKDGNGSKYKIIIKDNKNFESLWHFKLQSKVGDGKIFLENNPKLKDSNGIFKCNLPRTSVEIFAKNNSAFIITEFDMEAGTTYAINYERNNST